MCALASLPLDTVLSRWQDVSVVIWEGESVYLLLSCCLAEAHGIMECRVNERQAPYAGVWK